MNAEAAVPEVRRRRNAALRGAGGALLAALAILVVALLLEQDDTAAPPAAAVGRGPTAEGVRGDVPVPLAPPVASVPQAVEVEHSVLPPAVVPAVVSNPPEVVSMPPAQVAVQSEPASAAPPVDEADAVKTPSPLLGARSAPADGYRIQLGVFDDPANAIALQQDLGTRGLHAGIQSRVVLGPYANREAARKAQAALRAAGLETGMLVPPSKKKR
jgi:cell division septation protein DedD